MNYYTRPDGAHVKVDIELKQVTLALNIPVQKTISYITNPEYYDRMISEFEKYTVSDEASFTAAFDAVKAAIPGI